MRTEPTRTEPRAALVEVENSSWVVERGVRHTEWFVMAPYVSVEPAARWGLPLLYVVFVIAVVILYFPCRGFAGLKARGRHAWLRYL